MIYSGLDWSFDPNLLFERYLLHCGRPPLPVRSQRWSTSNSTARRREKSDIKGQGYDIIIGAAQYIRMSSKIIFFSKSIQEVKSDALVLSYYIRKDTTFARTMSPGLKLLYVSTCGDKRWFSLIKYWSRSWGSLRNHSSKHTLSFSVARTSSLLQSQTVISAKTPNPTEETTFMFLLGIFFVPDCSSETVFQRRGTHIKNVDFGEPGVDAGHLSTHTHNAQTHPTHRFIRYSLINTH